MEIRTREIAKVRVRKGVKRREGGETDEEKLRDCGREADEER